MNSPADLLYLPYTPDLTQAGIAYVCCRLACTYLAQDQKTYIVMRDLVALTAASLAFRRYLASESIAYTIQGALPYSDPASYTVRMGGRSCAVRSELIFDRKVIHDLRSQPAGILSRRTDIEVDDLETDPLLDDDLLVFALVFGLITRDQLERNKALDAGQPVCLIHTLPETWANPLPELPLGETAIKSNHDHTLKLDIGGRDLAGSYSEEILSLEPQMRTCPEATYRSIAFLRTDRPNSAMLGLSNTSMPNPTIVRSGQWGNIWIYGLEIILAGYLTRGEFRRQGTLQVDQDISLPVVSGKKKSLPYGQLHPMSGLLDWAEKR